MGGKRKRDEDGEDKGEEDVPAGEEGTGGGDQDDGHTTVQQGRKGRGRPKGRMDTKQRKRRKGGKQDSMEQPTKQRANVAKKKTATGTRKWDGERVKQEMIQWEK